MKLKVNKKLNYEILHFVDDEVRVASKHNKIVVEKSGKTISFNVPQGKLKTLLGQFRLFRRLLRLDKCNVFYNDQSLVIIRHGQVYHFDLVTEKLTQTLTLRNCRNVLHQSISKCSEGNIYFGEYGANKERKTVPVYRSSDGGMSWEEIYTFAAGEIKHIHGCYYDHYSDKVWVCTGDFKDENWLIQANKDFSAVERIGDGQQKFRACNLFFEKDAVHWIMDSQLETSYHIRLNRDTKETTTLEPFQGPVWYIKRLEDGYYLATTAQETGDGVLDEYAHLYISRDLNNWTILKSFEHDGLPKKYFKNGIIGFPDGKASSDKFYMFFEAVKGFDGKSVECSINF